MSSQKSHKRIHFLWVTIKKIVDIISKSRIGAMNLRKNILFLLVDQWPSDAFSHRGAAIKTPNMDRLASESTNFINAFTTCPLCSPARSVLLTGRWNTQTGLEDNMGVGYSTQEPLKQTEETWVDGAVAAGYHVGYYGKWHLGPNGPIIRGAKKHFDDIEPHSKPYMVGKSDYNYEACKLEYKKRADALLKSNHHFYGDTSMSIEETLPYKITEKGCAFIREYAQGDKEQPFMLTVSVNDPHFPHYLPKEFIEKIEEFPVTLPENLRDDFQDKPWFHNVPWWPSMDTSTLTQEDWLEVIRYAGMHRMLVDQALGRVLRTLDETGLSDETIVIFTSDHGDMCGAHNRFDKGPYYYDEVFRVPLMMKVPQEKPAIQKGYVSLIDLGKTLFDRMNHETKKPMFGRNIMPLIGKEEPPHDWQNMVYGMYEKYNGMRFIIRAIRNERFKYVYNPQDKDEFYDLDMDPHELHNKEADEAYTEEKTYLQRQLIDWMKAIDDPMLQETLPSIPQAGWIDVLEKPGP